MFRLSKLTTAILTKRRVSYCLPDLQMLLKKRKLASQQLPPVVNFQTNKSENNRRTNLPRSKKVHLCTNPKQYKAKSLKKSKPCKPSKKLNTLKNQKLCAKYGNQKLFSRTRKSMSKSSDMRRCKLEPAERLTTEKSSRWLWKLTSFLGSKANCSL